MTSLPRKRIGELIALYKLEPHIRDVYVEGDVDVPLIRKYIRETSKGVNVYAVGCIECDSKALAIAGLTNGNKNRIYWLADRLEKDLPPESDSVRCLADKDYDDVLGVNRTGRFLILCDETSLETLLFLELLSGSTLSDFIGRAIDSNRLLQQMHPILECIYLSRAASVVKSWDLMWVDPFRSVEVGRGEHAITFNSEDFEKRYLERNGYAVSREELRAVRNELKKAVPGSYFIRGHEAFSLLSSWLQKQNVEPAKRDISTLMGLARVSATVEQLSKYSMFDALYLWIANTA